jgi:hypothetical protein
MSLDNSTPEAAICHSPLQDLYSAEMYPTWHLHSHFILVSIFRGSLYINQHTCADFQPRPRTISHGDIQRLHSTNPQLCFLESRGQRQQIPKSRSLQRHLIRVSASLPARLLLPRLHFIISTVHLPSQASDCPHPTHPIYCG